MREVDISLSVFAPSEDNYALSTLIEIQDKIWTAA